MSSSGVCMCVGGEAVFPRGLCGLWELSPRLEAEAVAALSSPLLELRDRDREAGLSRDLEPLPGTLW